MNSETQDRVIKAITDQLTQLVTEDRERILTYLQNPPDDVGVLKFETKVDLKDARPKVTTRLSPTVKAWRDERFEELPGDGEQELPFEQEQEADSFGHAEEIRLGAEPAPDPDAPHVVSADSAPPARKRSRRKAA